MRMLSEQRVTPLLLPPHPAPPPSHQRPVSVNPHPLSVIPALRRGYLAANSTKPRPSPSRPSHLSATPTPHLRQPTPLIRHTRAPPRVSRRHQHQAPRAQLRHTSPPAPPRPLAHLRQPAPLIRHTRAPPRVSRRHQHQTHAPISVTPARPLRHAHSPISVTPAPPLRHTRAPPRVSRCHQHQARTTSPSRPHHISATPAPHLRHATLCPRHTDPFSPSFPPLSGNDRTRSGHDRNQVEQRSPWRFGQAHPAGARLAADWGKFPDRLRASASAEAFGLSATPALHHHTALASLRSLEPRSAISETRLARSAGRGRRRTSCEAGRTE